MLKNRKIIVGSLGQNPSKSQSQTSILTWTISALYQWQDEPPAFSESEEGAAASQSEQSSGLPFSPFLDADPGSPKEDFCLYAEQIMRMAKSLSIQVTFFSSMAKCPLLCLIMKNMEFCVWFMRIGIRLTDHELGPSLR